MKKIILFSALLGSFLIQAQRTCGTPQKLQEKIEADPNFATHYYNVREQLHAAAAASLLQSMSTESTSQPAIVVTVPVVVHILYKNTVQNISDAQIASQMTVLNNDYRKLNSDFATVVPAVWQPLGADMEINFVMATVDPNGNPTTGITRKSVPSSFVFDDNYYTSTGEVAWDTNEYLNIWVGNFTDTSLLGFAYPPAAAGTAFDGLCIDYNNFGTVGTSSNGAFNKGRTATHEIGHYFGLEHPWGNDGSACGSIPNSDGVADTPTVSGPTYFCPTFPDYDQACSDLGNGAMFMNYMDYVNDACMAFFTNGQKLLTNAAIAGPRQDVLGNPDIQANVQIKIYPNPVATEFTVLTVNQQLTKVELFNIAGQLVKTQALSGTEAKIDMREFDAGIYFARFYNGAKILKSEKLIKQ